MKRNWRRYLDPGEKAEIIQLEERIGFEAAFLSDERRQAQKEIRQLKGDIKRHARSIWLLRAKRIKIQNRATSRTKLAEKRKKHGR